MEKRTIIKKFIGDKIYSKIVNNYHRSTQLILNGEFEKLKDEYPNEYKYANSCTYNADTRPINEYVENLAFCWVMENFGAMLVEKTTGMVLSNSGSDIDRKILGNKYVSSKADFKLTLANGDIVNIEFITDFYGLSTKFKNFFLRNNKLPNLLRDAEKNKTMIFSIDMANSLYFLVDVTELNYVATERYGKPSNKVKIDFPQYAITKENLIRDFGKLND